MPAKSTSPKSTAKTPRGRKVSARESSAITKASSNTAATGLVVYREASWLPEHRPIASSSLVIAATFGGNLKRPIEASPDFAGTYEDAATRPIGTNNFKVSRTINMSGNRPIMETSLPIARTDRAFGDRPVAPNDVVDGDPATLMGYLD